MSTTRKLDALFYDKGGAVHNVQHSDFGAVGDGTTNDTTAIQSAIDAAEADGGGAVVFPDGSYSIDSGLTIDSPNVSLIGRGDAELDRSQTTSAGTDYNMLMISADNVEVLGLTFEQDEFGTGGDAADDDHRGILVSGANDITIRDCVFTNTGAYGIEANGSTNVRIENCDISKSSLGSAGDRGFRGISIVSSSFVTIVGNELTNLSNGIHAVVRSGEGNTRYDDMHDISVIGNNIRATTEHGIYMTLVQNLVVSGNTVDETDVAGIKVRAVDCSVTNNSIHSFTAGVVVSEFSTNVSIIGNSIFLDDTARSGSVMRGIGIDVQSLNTFLGNAENPSWIDSSSRVKNILASDNTIRYEGTAGNEETYGVRIIGSSNHTTTDDYGLQKVSISGNTIENFMTGIRLALSEESLISGNILVGQDTSSAPSSGNQGIGIVTSSTCPYLTVHSNSIRQFWDGVKFSSGVNISLASVVQNNVNNNNQYGFNYASTTGNSTHYLAFQFVESNTTNYNTQVGTQERRSLTTGSDNTGTNVFSTNANALGPNDGFIRFHDRNFNAVWVPYWDNVTP